MKKWTYECLPYQNLMFTAFIWMIAIRKKELNMDKKGGKDKAVLGLYRAFIFHLSKGRKTFLS